MPLLRWYNYNNDNHQTWFHYSARLWRYPTHCGWPCPPTRLGRTLSSPSWCWWWYWWWWWYGCWTVCGTFVILVHLQRDNTDLLLAINFNFVSFWSGLSRCKNVKKLSAQRKSTRADYYLLQGKVLSPICQKQASYYSLFLGPMCKQLLAKLCRQNYMLGLWITEFAKMCRNKKIHFNCGVPPDTAILQKNYDTHIKRPLCKWAKQLG